HQEGPAIWPGLIAKAYAVWPGHSSDALHGYKGTSYPGIEGGDMTQAFAHVLGWAKEREPEANNADVLPGDPTYKGLPWEIAINQNGVRVDCSTSDERDQKMTHVAANIAMRTGQQADAISPQLRRVGNNFYVPSRLTIGALIPAMSVEDVDA